MLMNPRSSRMTIGSTDLSDLSQELVRVRPDMREENHMRAVVCCHGARVDYYLKTLAQSRQFYFVIGFDLVGQENKEKLFIEFADKLNTVDPIILFFFLHSGETNWNSASTNLNLFDTFLFILIGHE